jgi:hypothetical protein
VRREGGKLKPFATILRFRWDADDRQGSTLVVTKLGEDDACHEQARAIADHEAASFTCKKDKAKHY